MGILFLFFVLSMVCLFAGASGLEFVFLRKMDWAGKKTAAVQVIASNLVGSVVASVVLYVGLILYVLGMIAASYDLPHYIKDPTLEGIATVAYLVIGLVIILAAMWVAVFVVRALAVRLLTFDGSTLTWKYAAAVSVFTVVWIVGGLLLAVVLAGIYGVAVEDFKVRS